MRLPICRFPMEKTHRDTEGIHYMTLRNPGVSTALDKAGRLLQALRSVVFVNTIRDVY
jgi:hypothetical protein